MKIPKGKTVYVGRKKFTDEIPDALAKLHGLTEEKLTKKKSKPETPKKEGKKE
jgi:DNA polymerase III epsilon subunit-like protein